MTAELPTGATTEPQTEPPRLFPTLRYRDADAAIFWLTDTVGFCTRVIHRDGPIVTHAELAFGSSILMLGTARDDSYGELIGDPAGRRTDSIYVGVDDIDALFARVTASAAVIVTELHDTSYGSRDFACRDAEGNL